MAMVEDGPPACYRDWHIWVLDGLRWVHQEHVKPFYSGAIAPSLLIQILDVEAQWRKC